ncbi:MAG: hypothetical protein JJU03_11630 [Idiomarina sp.]|nr:hypothetical protein [Idiomarina sp.]
MPLWHPLSVRKLTVTPFLLSAILLTPALCLPAYASAQEPAEESSEPSTQAQTDEQQQEEDDDDDMVIDSIQQGVQTSVDATARWFDNFFGDGRSFDDQYRSQGRFSVAPEWSQYDGWSVGSSFRAQVNLPLAEDRFSAFVGRVGTDDYVVGEDSERRASVLRNVTGDSEWLVGLGFNPNQGEENRFSASVGIRGGLRADLYTEARYLYQIRVTESSQVRTRSALFWRDSDGFGFAQRLDYEQTWGKEWLGRFSTEATTAERVDGIRWRNTTSLYHLYDDNKAIAGEFWYRGESKAEVPDEDFGVRLIHRQSWLRDWFYVEKWIGSHWPKEEPHENRSQAWLVGIEFEVWFGQ